jgi:membrane protein DedA with SNARE-associated domain
MDLLTPGPEFLFFTLLTIGLWIIGLIFLAFVVWRRKDLNQSTKILWSLFFAFIPHLAFIGYYVFGRKKEAV